MKFFDLFWICYPLLNTYRVLKYPRLKLTKHWLTFWYLFLLLELIELVTFSYVPFWGAIKPILLVINWKPTVTEITWKFMNVGIKHVWSKLKNVDQFNLILVKCNQLWQNLILPLINQLNDNGYLNWMFWLIAQNVEPDTTTNKKKED